jgi:hypothetical protein
MLLGWWCGEIDTHVHHRDLSHGESSVSLEKTRWCKGYIKD